MFGDAWDNLVWSSASAFIPEGGAISYEQLRSLRLSPLEQAVREWAVVRDRLGEMLPRAREDMLNSARQAGWRGVNADVTLPVVGSTAEKFEYAHQQAGAFQAQLDQLHIALAESKRTLENVEAQAAAEGVRIDARGVARTADPPHLSLQDARGGMLMGMGEYGELTEAQGLALSTAEVGIQRALAAAAESEQVAIRTIREILGSQPGEFSATHYRADVDPSRIQTFEDVNTFTELAQRSGPLSPRRAEEMRELLERHGDDPLFAEHLLRTLGLHDFLELSQRIDAEAAALDDSGALATALQGGLGNVLAAGLRPPGDLASQPPGSSAWEQWADTPQGQRYAWRMEEFSRFGVLELYEGDDRLGYDVALDLLEQADTPLDDQFFDQLLSGMIEGEKNDPAVWEGERYDGEDGWDARNDPVDRLLGLAARSNPDAVTAYFDPGEAGSTERLDYFTGNGEGSRETFHGFVDGADVGELTSQSFHESPGLTAALGVAATGTAPDDLGAPFQAHSEANIRVAEHVWNTFTQEPSRIAGHDSEFASLLGHIGADYIADIQNAANGSHHSALSGPEASFDTTHTASLLWELGKHQEAYERITAANQAEMFVSVDAAVSGEFSQEEARQDAIDSVVYRAGQVAGMMSDAHATGMIEAQAASDQAHNAPINEISTLTDRALNVAVYRYFRDSPAVAATVDAYATDGIEAIADLFRTDNRAAAEQDAEGMYAYSRRGYQDAVEQALATAYGVDPDSLERNLREPAMDRAGQGYDGGTTRNLGS